jgi:hypothetical protein
MAKVIISLKFITFWIYSYSLSPAAQIFMSSVNNRVPPNAAFWIFFTLMFLPEFFMVVSPGFRNWVKEGFSDVDGRMSDNDRKGILIHYTSLWCMKLFVLENLLILFYGISVEFIAYIFPFFGSIGLSGFEILKNIVKAKESK